MRSSLTGFLLVLLIATVIPMPVDAQAEFPRMTGVTPDTGKAGDVLTVEGENLEKSGVKEIYRSLDVPDV